MLLIHHWRAEFLWQGADRVSMIHGLMRSFFCEQQTKLKRIPGPLPDDQDEYAADNDFWVPPESR